MNIAAYCRVSTDHEDQRNSLAHQLEFFSTYAENNHHQLYKVYADEGISGTSFKRRTEFLKLMEDAKSGAFEMVVVKDVSRFARNTVDFLQSIRTLKAMGINTLFLTANMTSLGDSEFILTIFGAMAQEESANLSRRVKWGKQINAAKGRVPPQIFGYDRVDNFTLRINAEEAAVVKEIYRLYLEEGLGCRRISRQLNETGARTKLGYDWAPYMVRRILSNSIYCGIYVNNRYEVEDFLSGREGLRPESEWLTHDRPAWAVVSKEDFERVRQQLAMRRGECTHKKVAKTGRYSVQNVFSALIRCEECGRSYVRRVRRCKKEYHYWVCSASQTAAGTCPNRVKFKEETLLRIICDYMTGFVDDREAFLSSAVQDAMEALRDERKDDFVSGKELERRRYLLQKQRETYQEMYANDALTMAELKKKLGEIAAKTKRLDTVEQADAVQAEKIREQRYRKEAECCMDFETITNVDLRKIIDHIGVKADGTVNIYVRSVHDPLGLCPVVGDGRSC